MEVINGGTKNFIFTRNSGKFRLSEDIMGDEDRILVSVYNVPMISIDISSIGSIQCPIVPSGPDFIVTGQLTGCSFVYVEDKTTMRCYHVAASTIANSITPGADLNNRLVNGGNFAHNNKNFKVFGRNDYSDCSSANIIGVRDSKNGWSIYAQGMKVSDKREISFVRKLF